MVTVLQQSVGFQLVVPQQHHCSNMEVLTDAMAMSKCQFLLHGHSNVSESTIYWNLELQNNSVNLEDPRVMPLDTFERLVKQHIAASS